MRKHKKKFLCLCTASGLLLAAPAEKAGTSVLTDTLTVRAEAASAEKGRQRKEWPEKRAGKIRLLCKREKGKKYLEDGGKHQVLSGQNRKSSHRCTHHQ